MTMKKTGAKDSIQKSGTLWGLKRTTGLKLARPILSSILAMTIAATSYATASADTFFFRYKTPVSTAGVVIPPIGEPTLEAGNDITIFFAGVIGKSFSKSIPVKTTAVAEWRLSSGSIQPGLDLDPATGLVSGVAEGPEAQRNAVLKGYDVSGNLVARAAINFRFHDVRGDEQQFTFYGHVGKYMYHQIPSTVPVDHWAAMTDLPADFGTEGSYFEGTPTKTYQTDAAFIGYDYMGEEITYAYGDILVEDGPQFLKVADQTRRPDESFSVQPVVPHSVGALQWSLIALDGKPSTLKINSKTGLVYGFIKTFDTSLRFQVKAIDADGSAGTSNVFTLSTSAADVDISSLSSLHATYGIPYSVQLKAKDLVGVASWNLNAGKLPAGLSLDPNTGIISGTPTKIGVETGLVVSVSTSEAGYSESNPFKFTVDALPLSVSFAQADVRTNESFTTAGPTLGTGVVAPYSFSLIDPAAVDPSLMIDTASAVVSGAPTEAGDYSVPFTFHNGDTREKTAVQIINAYDPLTLSYDDITVYRRLPAAAAPVTDWNNVIGTASFSLSGEALPEGLALDPSSGDIKGTVSTFDGATDVQVKLADESGDSVNSNVFDVNVEDRPNVEVTAANVEVERLVGNTVQAATAQNTFDGVAFTLIEGELPEGLSLDPDGVIRGVTDAVPGIVSGLKVMAVDGEGYSAESDYFSITLVQPKDLAPLSSTLTEARWPQATPFALRLPTPSNAWGAVTYGFLGLPDGVSVVDGKLVGQIDELGTYVWPMVMTDQAGRVLSADYKLDIIEAMTAELDGPGLAHGEEDPDAITFGLPRGSAATISAVVSNAIDPVTYKLEGSVPAGLLFANGSISGKPLVEGDTGQFTLTVTDAAGTSVPLPASINVLERLPISLSYDINSPAGYAGSQIAALKPTISNSIGTVSYAVDGILPPGLTLDPKTGYIHGTPTKDGWFSDIIVSAADSDGGSDYGATYGPFKIGIALNGNVGIPSNTFITVRAGQPFEHTLSATNVTAPVIYGTASGTALPYGLALDNFTGKISGMMPIAGKYPLGGVVAIDSFDRQGTTAVTVTAVGDLAITAPSATQFHQYSSVSIKPAVVNYIGATSYQLVSGALPAGLSFDVRTGAISGVPTVKGTFPGLVIKVTDSTGSAVQTAAFSLTVTDRLPLTMATQDSYTVVANGPFTLAMPVTNAVGAVTFVQTGTLPDGIKFDAATGTFSGRTDVLGSYPGITVTATDSVGGTGGTVTSTFTLVSEVRGAIRLFFRDFATRVGEPINTGATLWQNTIGEVSFSDDGSLAEHGLTLDSKTGRITGTATELMNFNPNINITDETNRITSGTFSIKVVPQLAINAPDRIELVVNAKMNPVVTLSAANSTSDNVEWGFEGALPAGMSFSKSSARFSGTPKELGTFPVKVYLHEVDGFQDTVSKVVNVVIVSDGKAPTIAVTPLTSGYDAAAAATVTPKYGNAKIGDVTTLAPGSAPLPPGMTIEKNSAGVFVLKKAQGSVDNAGVYRGIKLRVTDGSGLYGETDPFTIVYQTALTYPTVKVATQAYVPVTVAAAVPSKGKPSGTTTFSFLKDISGGALKIDASTGAISGYVTTSGTNTVQVIDSYDGIVLRKVTYSVAFTTSQVSVTINKDLVTYTDMPFPAAVAGYVPTVQNALSGSALSLVGDLPAGMSFIAATGALSGTPTVAGSFPLEIVYTDQYQTVSQAFTLRVEQSDPDGYKYARVLWTKINASYLHVWNYAVRSQGGYDMMHIIPMGAGTVNAETQTALKAKSHMPTTVLKGQYQTWNFPVGIGKGAITFGAHGGNGGTLVISVSKDGQAWVDLNTETVTDTMTTYREPFEAKPVVFNFNAKAVAAASKRLAYSFDLATLIDDGTLSGVAKTDLAWTWAVDPARDTATTMSTLPQGLSLSGSVISGTPVNSGNYALVLTASALGKTVTRQVTLTSGLQTTALALATATLPQAAGSTAYTYDMSTLLTATNIPKASVKWAAAAGTAGTGETAGLPAGISLSQAGILTGAPSVAGTFVFNVTATFDDANAVAEHVTATRSYKLVTNIVNLSSLTMMAAGDRHTCAVKPNGAAYCWGLNGSGQLGIGNTTGKLVPTAIPTLSSGVASISPGGTQTCALKSDGTVYCWGNGVTSPAKVNGLGAVTQVNAFGDRMCAVTQGKVAYCWAGTGTPTIPVGLDSNVASVSAGYGYQCAVKTDGSLWCWGGNGNGILGIGSTTAQTNPTKVTTLGDVKKVAAGWRHTCAIKTDGTAWCWGLNGHGQLGDNTNVTKTSPVQVQGLDGAVDISVGYDFSCAVKSDGSVVCWGFGENGKLGINSTADKWVPQQVSTLTSGVSTINIGGAQACVVKTDETKWCWGRNSSGELGINSTSDKFTPTAVNAF
ncbi:putative Ig domain protein [compost metagenome]